MRKLLLVALAVTLGFVSQAHAVCDTTTTCMTAIDVSGNASAGTLTVSGSASLTGVLNTASSTAYAIKISSTTGAIPAGTPTAAGLVAFDKSFVMYVSTGTTANSWVKVGGQ